MHTYMHFNLKLYKLDFASSYPVWLTSGLVLLYHSTCSNSVPIMLVKFDNTLVYT